MTPESLAVDIVFPSVATRILSAILHFVGSSILSFCLARRTAHENLDSFSGWRQLSFARLTIILIFSDSFLFLLLTGILIHGVGLELDESSCDTAIFLCISLYTSSKVLIYFFLTEKVWIVWSNNSNDVPVPRLKSPVYCVCLGSIILYSICLVLLVIYRVALIRESDGVCLIGFARGGSLPLLTYDAYITVLLTSLFIYPLWRDKVVSSKLRRVAARALVASSVALATSTLNIAVLTSQGGKELGWVCLASCGADVTVNALVLYSVTQGRVKRHRQAPRGDPTFPNIPNPFRRRNAEVMSTPSFPIVDRRSRPESLVADPNTHRVTLSRRTGFPDEYLVVSKGGSHPASKVHLGDKVSVPSMSGRSAMVFARPRSTSSSTCASEFSVIDSSVEVLSISSRATSPSPAPSEGPCPIEEELVLDGLRTPNCEDNRGGVVGNIGDGSVISFRAALQELLDAGPEGSIIRQSHSSEASRQADPETDPEELPVPLHLHSSSFGPVSIAPAFVLHPSVPLTPTSSSSRRTLYSITPPNLSPSSWRSRKSSRRGDRDSIPSPSAPSPETPRHSGVSSFWILGRLYRAGPSSLPEEQPELDLEAQTSLGTHGVGELDTAPRTIDPGSVETALRGMDPGQVAHRSTSDPLRTVNSKEKG